MPKQFVNEALRNALASKSLREWQWYFPGFLLRYRNLPLPRAVGLFMFFLEIDLYRKKIEEKFE